MSLVQAAFSWREGARRTTEKDGPSCGSTTTLNCRWFRPWPALLSAKTQETHWSSWNTLHGYTRHYFALSSMETHMETGNKLWRRSINRKCLNVPVTKRLNHVAGGNKVMSPSTNVSVKCIQFAIPRMNMYCVHLITILLTTFSKIIFIHMMSCEHSVAFTYNPHRWHRALPRGCTRSETTLLLAVREDENRGKMELHYGLSPMMVSRWPFTQYTYNTPIPPELIINNS